MIFKDLNKNERKIFIIHLIYSIIEGTILGVLVLNEFVFIKSLSGSDFQIGLLFQFSMIVFIFAVLVHEIIKRFKKQTILRVSALITRLPLLLFIFFPADAMNSGYLVYYHTGFLLVFLCFYLSTPVVFPIINSILKNNYRDKYFGSLYSYATTSNKVAMLAATYFFGVWLDFDNFAFVYVYPLMGVIGIISLFLLSKGVKVSYLGGSEKTGSLLDSVKNSVLNMRYIVKTNKPYRDFELGFMLYGFAFMLTIAVISIFMAKELGLNYTSIAFYKNSYNIIAIAALPVFGKLMDKMDPRKFGIISFSALMLYLLFMALTEYFPYYADWGIYRFYWLLIISFAFNGLFAGSMPLLWNIGSAYFCSTEEAAEYQSVHLTFVGLRGIAAPLFGVGLYQYIGFTGVFGLGIFFLALAMYVMYWSMKRKKLIRAVRD